jgi:DHA3 family macrolide efflux protein-like MFS transporter
MGTPDWKRPFFTLWIGQAFSLLGSQLVQFALVWWLTQSTGSAAVLAAATTAALLPNIFLSPVAGALVDRWNRRTVMMVADSLIALATLGLIVLFATGAVRVWHVYVIMLIRAAGGAFHWPAMQASTSLMVPEAQLSRVQGLNSTLNGGMNIVAPPLGALLLEVLPVQGVLAVDIVTAALGLTTLALIHIPQPERTPGADSRSVGSDLREGLNYVRGWPGLMILLAMAVVINFLLVPAGTLLPLLVKDHFSGGALEFSWMESAFGIGMVVGGIVLSVWGGFERKIVTAQLALVGIGWTHVVLGLLPGAWFEAALAALFAAGFMLSINGVIYAALQAIVAPDMQGRVFTLVGSAASAMTPLSLAIAGPLADQFGVRFWYVLAGAACVVMGSTALTIPAVLNVERGPVAQKPIAGEV